MLTPTRTRRSIFVSLLVAACLAVPAVPDANHSWNGYHWARAANPFTVALGDNLSAAWDPYLATTSSDWSASAVLNTTIVAGRAKPRNCRPTAGRVEVCNSTYGNTGWLGVAQIWVSGSHITQGTVKINDSYFNTPQYDTPGWRNLVMCQEVGHTFGLDHQDENFDNPNLGTCMDYTSNPYGPPDNEHPDQHDYDELLTIYSHLDGSGAAQSTAADTPMPPAMTDIDLEGPAQWGRLRHNNHNGKLALFEADFGHGHKVFTFVIWA
jgi:hypothetical protein